MAVGLQVAETDELLAKNGHPGRPAEAASCPRIAINFSPCVDLCFGIVSGSNLPDRSHKYPDHSVQVGGSVRPDEESRVRLQGCAPPEERGRLPEQAPN